jgi:hypothetical protein
MAQIKKTKAEVKMKSDENTSQTKGTKTVFIFICNACSIINQFFRLGTII